MLKERTAHQVSLSVASMDVSAAVPESMLPMHFPRSQVLPCLYGRAEQEGEGLSPMERFLRMGEEQMQDAQMLSMAADDLEALIPTVTDTGQRDTGVARLCLGVIKCVHGFVTIEVIADFVGGCQECLVAYPWAAQTVPAVRVFVDVLARVDAADWCFWRLSEVPMDCLSLAACLEYLGPSTCLVLRLKLLVSHRQI